MKTLKPFKLALICACILIHHSCQNASVVNKSENIVNSINLDHIKDKINLIAINENILRDTITVVNLQPNNIGIDVNLRAEIFKLFDPENHPCKLPSKITKKLKDLKDGGNPWAPEFVLSHIAQMPITAIYIPRESISNILHRVTIKKSNVANNFSWLVISSPTYNELNVEDYILSGYNSFFYSLDCSGYLNAAIGASGATPGADIKVAAESALITQNSMFVGGGVVISPLLAAYYGNLVTMDKSLRINILTALMAIPNIADDDIIEMDLSFDAVWSSKTGSSSFNGKADLKANVGANIGLAQISSSAGGGGAVARKSTFSNFNTYITKEAPVRSPQPITVLQIRKVLRDLNQK
ncbi:hypothetical protein AB1278_19620 [Chryseobacterium sp. NRRL B-14798]|uniref:hypothetical protein n=1 Tax=Chryseobacterium sp. NRRL B-14798 TaxID=3162880 RepID=UPI003D1DB6A1